MIRVFSFYANWRDENCVRLERIVPKSGWIVLTAVFSQLRDDTVDDCVGDTVRQFEGTTFSYDFDGLEAGIVEYLASAALEQVQIEFLADLR